MSKNKKLISFAGGVLFGIGIILGFILCGVMIWGDMEATLFTTGVRADESLSTLRCPVLITASETGSITAVVNNDTGKHMERNLIANISEGYATLVREMRTSLAISPNGKEKVEWKIYPEDAAFDQSVILFRVFIFPRSSQPSLGGNCGVVRVNIEGVTGDQLFNGSVALALVGLGGGAAMLEFGSWPTKGRSRKNLNNVYALAGIIFATAILGFLGLWVPGVGLLAIAVLLAGVFVTRRLTGIG